MNIRYRELERVLSSEHDVAAATLELTAALVTFIRWHRIIPVTNPINDEGWIMRPPPR